MKNNNLLASVALFGELYNNDTFKSIPDILAEFIKGAIVFEKKFSVNSTELKDILKKVYGFTIPESVLRTTLKNRLKDIVDKDSDGFHFDAIALEDCRGFRASFESINGKQNDILKELYKYIKVKKGAELSAEEKGRIFENFSHFLMDNGYSDDYSELISAFIISKETDSGFTKELDTIKEGLILYQGINYSADISQLGSWKDKLTIYLSTEHLFNCLGYNGILFKEIFDDLLKLVNEINIRRDNKSGENLIHLKYLEETKDEIEHFFKTAESIKKGYSRLDSSKVAMANILKDCEEVSDIKEKQVNFFLKLKRQGITYQECLFDIDNSQYNVVDWTVIDNLRKISEKSHKPFKEEYCLECLQLFSKINTFRQGKNNLPFEKIKHIYITENRFARYLGHNNTVKFKDTDAAFAKDIDYVITKFWFKLKKGFKDKAALPKTFDLVTKAKIIMASHINNSLSDNYDKLQSKFKEGELSEEIAVELSHAYKEKPNSPELITQDNIDDSLRFLDDENFIEDFLREKTRKETEFQETLQKKEALEIELQLYKQKELEAERQKAEKELEDKKLKELAEVIKQSEIYADKEWTKMRKENNSNLTYMMFSILIMAIPIGIGLLLKLYAPFALWLTSIGKYQILVWVLLLFLFLAELFGRTYIFNKERVKNGWIYFICLIRLKHKTYKIENLKELKKFYQVNYADDNV